MKREKIYGLISSLALSQGYYGRLKSYIDGLSESDKEQYWAYLESQNFNDILDVIFFFES